MLAKDVKIRTLAKQREYIRKQILEMEQNKNGDVIYKHEGYVYQEVIQYFEEEGYIVKRFGAETFMANPIYIFIGDVKLSTQEMQQAEDYGAVLKDDFIVDPARLATSMRNGWV